MVGGEGVNPRAALGVGGLEAAELDPSGEKGGAVTPSLDRGAYMVCREERKGLRDVLSTVTTDVA